MTIVDCRVYVPAKDFALSQRFYRELGFTLTSGWGGTVDCELGAMRFRLQDYYVADWASNLMFAIGVDDAAAWYQRAAALAASGDFPGMRVKPPEDVDGNTVTHVVDPSGVLLVLIGR
jgi:catechol 2,3-dioxygenase-like lactoylglutathione lyase family enzyme